MSHEEKLKKLERDVLMLGKRMDDVKSEIASILATLERHGKRIQAIETKGDAE